MANKLITRTYIARFKDSEAEFSSPDRKRKTHAWRILAYGKYHEGDAISYADAKRQAEFLLCYSYGAAKEYEIVKLTEAQLS